MRSIQPVKGSVWRKQRVWAPLSTGASKASPPSPHPNTQLWSYPQVRTKQEVTVATHRLRFVLNKRPQFPVLRHFLSQHQHGDISSGVFFGLLWHACMCVSMFLCACRNNQGCSSIFTSLFFNLLGVYVHAYAHVWVRGQL